ncbi:MAG: FAD synthetase [Parcubacteria group bacterium Gr01-1014_13]|nr:MAG: FAD synthetase [Parcubacteria group bacterium Gr01-1014_13]
MKKVLAFGTFDILHPGHMHVLEAAKKLGDHLTVIIARDATVLKVKGQEPVFNEKTRLKNLKKLNIADKVRLGSLGNKYQVIIDEKPDIIALGYDQKFFVDDLKNFVGKDIRIVRLKSYKPKIHKSSKMRGLYEKNSNSH